MMGVCDKQGRARAVRERREAGGVIVKERHLRLSHGGAPEA